MCVLCYISEKKVVVDRHKEIARKTDKIHTAPQEKKIKSPGFYDEISKATSQFNQQNIKWHSVRRWRQGGDVPWI